MSCSSTNGHEPPALFNLSDTQTVNLLEDLYSFKLFYGNFHRYISFFLCTAGILANICHICVLTRSHMRKSSVNTTLTCIAIADIGTMTSYLIYITRYEFLSEPNGYGFYWAEFLRLHAVVSIALHAVSLYFVVFMAFIRLMALDIGQSKWMMPRLACIICIIIMIIIFIMCVPTFLAHEVYERNDAEISSENLTLIVSSNLISMVKINPNNNKYSVGFSKVFLDEGCALLKFNLWLTGLLLKALPCFLLFWFTIALLRRLRANERKRQERFFRMADERSISNTTTITAGCTTNDIHKRLMADRTTYVLILMLSVFLLTELPQGLFAILNAMYIYQLYVYMSIADVLDLLSLINCYVAFIVYMLTSSTYRHTLFTMFISILPKSASYNKLIVRQDKNNSDEKRSMNCVITYGPQLKN